jgi:hypothetical protein
MRSPDVILLILIKRDTGHLEHHLIERCCLPCGQFGDVAFPIVYLLVPVDESPFCALRRATSTATVSASSDSSTRSRDFAITPRHALAGGIVLS